jgi:hypothetical protein
VEDVKAHFETATKVVGTHTAKLLDDLREQYSKEVQRVDKVQREFQSFERLLQHSFGKLKNEVASASADSNSQIQELQNTLDELSEKRQVDRRSMELEVSLLGKKVSEVQTGARGGNADHSTRTDILSWLLSSQMMSAAIDMQDDHDRKAVALYGYKAGGEGPAPHGAGANMNLSSTVPTLPGLARDRGGDSARARTPRKHSLARKTQSEDFRDPVYTVDKRCLSCSGTSQTVLAGFKMACLQYAPGPVAYERAMYSRSELIRMRIDLLTQAKDQLQLLENQRHA